ncbi:OLC1v1032221C1 [Oldenlandia corymbosa var. corymbosa]|uniref:OLC1v1032221C1 n=1 Tax=Oldenlandia corymbosa var. corymbosa TaxID=529605 RepID=A0AAV1CLB1_OLDCO|nr:OLC1v1032221C1 [Oldenlandia corymbosa var. corymbosa]
MDNNMPKLQPQYALMDWSSLIPDLLVEIATRLPDVEDFMAFRGVCAWWRTAVTKDKFGPSWPRVPLLMLVEKEEEGSMEREFYSLSKSKVCMRSSLPLAKGKRCFEVRFGWLMSLADYDEVTLWNPLSGLQFGLPDFQGFPDYRDCDPLIFITKAVLSENPSKVSDFTLVAICRSVFLVFWRPGNRNWTLIKTKRDSAFLDVNYFKGKFHAINTCGNIWVWDGNTPLAHIVLSINFYLLPRYSKLYLVESSSKYSSETGEAELLLILRLENMYEDGDDSSDEEADQVYKTKYFYTRHFKVYQLDTARNDWAEIPHLGGDALFVGYNATIAVPGSEPKTRNGIKPNCIYFSDDRWLTFQEMGGGGRDMGIYNMEDGNVERLDGLDVGIDVQDKSVLSFISPPLWIPPNT